MHFLRRALFDSTQFRRLIRTKRMSGTSSILPLELIDKAIGSRIWVVMKTGEHSLPRGAGNAADAAVERQSENSQERCSDSTITLVSDFSQSIRRDTPQREAQVVEGGRAVTWAKDGLLTTSCALRHGLGRCHGIVRILASLRPGTTADD